MISYSSLDELDNRIPKPRIPVPQIQKRNKTVRPFAKEDTECNYLLMFFIVGMFIIVVSDQLK
jgi:hypothetical protein